MILQWEEEESESIVMIPPNVEKPQMQTTQTFKPNGSGDMDIIFLPSRYKWYDLSVNNSKFRC